MNITNNIAARNASHIDASKSISWNGLYELTKPRLSFLSVFTASLGFLVHDPLKSDLVLFLALTIGTALSAGGAAAPAGRQGAPGGGEASRPRCQGRTGPG